MSIIETFKNKYIEFTPEWSGFNITYHVAGYFDSRPNLQIYFIWGKLFIYLPWKHYKKIEVDKTEIEKRKDKLSKLKDSNYKESKKYIKEIYDDCTPPSYGIYFYMDQFGIRLGDKVKLYDLPWCYEWIRTSALGINGEWYHENKKNRNMDFYDTNKWKDKLYIEKVPYTYITKQNEKQECLATIRVEEREWRWKWLTWLKLFSKVRREIDVVFSTDIGERKSSWKGGVTGCGYTLLKNETPIECLRRMERERIL